jgi:hypothetical protein
MQISALFLKKFYANIYFVISIYRLFVQLLRAIKVFLGCRDTAKPKKRLGESAPTRQNISLLLGFSHACPASLSFGSLSNSF